MAVNQEISAKRSSLPKWYAHLVELILVLNVVGYIVFTIIEVGNHHDGWIYTVEAIMFRVSSVLIPASAMALVILEVSMILARYLYDDDKRSQEEAERQEQIEVMLKTQERIEGMLKTQERMDDMLKTQERIEGMLKTLVDDVEELKNDKRTSNGDTKDKSE